MIVEFRNISKVFGGVQALKKVNMTLKSGDIRALLGGNGSGKSTLIKIASGLIKPEEGEIFIDGKLVKTTSPKASKNIGIVSTAQELSILSNLTVGENITLCALPKYSSGFTNQKQIRKDALAILEKLNMAEDIDTPVSVLPVNKQYMIEFGKAIYQKFDILLIDEITSALYSEEVIIVKKLLDEYKDQGKVILLISHRMQEIYSMCDSVTVMRNGEIIDTLNLKEADQKHLLTLMVGDSSYESADSKNTDNSNIRRESEVFISVKNLSIKKYNTRLDLNIHHGEIIGVAGLQGHGQAEIVRTLFGINGKIIIDKNGVPVSIGNPRQAVKNKFAFVSGDREKEGSFRRHNLMDNVGVVSDLVLGPQLNAKRSWLSFDKNVKDTDGIFKEANVKYSSSFQNITSLSGGNQQKVLFCRWTSIAPDLLLADDPSKGIDVQARSEMRQLLERLSMNGMAMVIVSSDEDELVVLCANKKNARVIVLYEGNIIETLRGSDVTRNNIISAALGKKRN